MRRLRALPIRVRVTLAFTAAMAALLAGLGVFLYVRLGDGITETIDTGLEARAGGSDGFGSGEDGNFEDDESFAQLLDAEGEVVRGTAQLGELPAIGGEELAQASAGPTFTEIPQLPGLEGPFRVLAAPAGGGRITVVGASLDDRDEALSDLLALLLIGGPVALILASLAGYAAIAAALRPVERMRERAESIGGSDPSERLPVGAGDDELSRLAETLNAMLARLETAIERERRFVDDASHELRTPLALHKTALELALRYEEDDPALRTAIASGIEEVDRLIQLAEDLLVVARSEAGELEIDPVNVGSTELFEAVSSRFESRCREYGRGITVDRGPDLRLHADRLRIEQALTNLVDNALRHGAGAVLLRAEPRDGAVRLHVSDAGEGFPEIFLPSAFDRFSRADTARTAGGSGLGLAIVKTIAEAHGGSAGAANTPSGPDVWVELPSA